MVMVSAIGSPTGADLRRQHRKALSMGVWWCLKREIKMCWFIWSVCLSVHLPVEFSFPDAVKISNSFAKLWRTVVPGPVLFYKRERGESRGIKASSLNPVWDLGRHHDFLGPLKLLNVLFAESQWHQLARHSEHADVIVARQLLAVTNCVPVGCDVCSTAELLCPVL